MKTNLQKLKLVVAALTAFGLVACGAPSKEDVCGSCDETTKAACETGYDVCDGDKDCIDAYEDGIELICPK